MGNAEWGWIFVLERQYHFQMLTTAISDLDAVWNMFVADALKYLDASRAKQLAAAQRDHTAAAAALEKLKPTLEMVRIYAESSPEFGLANARVRAESFREDDLYSL